MTLYNNEGRAIQIELRKSISGYYNLYCNEDFYCTCESRVEADEEIEDIKQYYHLSYCPLI